MWSAAEKYVLAQNITKNGEVPKTLGDIPWGGGFNQCKKIFDEALRKIAMLGYGVILISHSKEVKKKDDNGVEYDYTTCSLPDMAKLIANRFVDLICFLKTDRDGNRWLYTRDTGKFNIEVGSRFQYLDERIPLGYENLVNALEKAIKAEAESKGRTNFDNIHKEDGFLKTERTYEEVMEEARKTFQDLISKDKANAEKMNNIILKHFGTAIKLSETTSEQKEIVETVLDEWKELL
jgi:hypothetical protein